MAPVDEWFTDEYRAAHARFAADAGSRAPSTGERRGNDGCRYANGFDVAAWQKYAGIDTSGYPLFDPLPRRDGWLNTSPVGALAPNKFGV